MQGWLRRTSALCGLLLVGWPLGCGAADGADTPPKETCAEVVTDGGGGIVQPPKGAEAPECQPDACNFQSQAGCDATQSCLPSVKDDAVFTDCFASGTKALGEACKAANDCVHGAVCAAGFCRKLCCAGDWSVCDQGESCFREFEYAINDVPTPTGAWVCYPVGTCSVLDSKACDAEGKDCKMVDSRGSEACVTKSPGALGEPCGAATGRLCGRGLACVGEVGEGACRRLCRAEECGEPSCPAAEGTCVHFDRDPPGVGECTPGW